jgi:ethylbenzene dioxygenase beta subunit
MKFPLASVSALQPAELSRDAVFAVEQFLYREARLLDEDNWDDWLALFSDDGMYWAPLIAGQDNPLDHVSLFWENALLREVRVKRLTNPRNWSQQPRSRCARVVGGVMVDGIDPDTGDLVVSSRFHFAEWRKDTQRALAGSCRHHLVQDGAGFRIRLKRVDLINSESVHDILQVFI